MTKEDKQLLIERIGRLHNYNSFNYDEVVKIINSMPTNEWLDKPDNEGPWLRYENENYIATQVYRNPNGDLFYADSRHNWYTFKDLKVR